MSLLQIAEPNQSADPHQQKHAIGIDLGTTRSMVAIVRSGKADIIPAENNIDSLLPSVAYYGEHSGSTVPVVGHAALDYFKRDPKNTIISAKRFLGRDVDDIKFSHPYSLVQSDKHPKDTSSDKTMLSFATAQGIISPVQVAAEILTTLYRRAATSVSNDDISGAVITVPAYFDEAQRQATKDAAQIAGISVLRLLNEPTAAAVAYGLDAKHADGSTTDNHQLQHYLIYDLGGGTFDVSLLTMANGVLEVKATGGNSALGGDDIDRLIMGWMLKHLGIDASLVSATQKSELARLAESYKIQLSNQTTSAPAIDVSFALGDDTWQGQLSHADLVDIAAPVVKRTLALSNQVLNDANMTAKDLDAVVLVGGSTRMPVIQQAVTDFFGQIPLSHINPDEVVALGAAIVADQLTKVDKSDNLLLLDVTPLSLGLETMGGLVEVLIPRNTPIPITKKQTFTTYKDGQTGMVIHVVQGERDTVEQCRSLGKFELHNIPPMKAGLARIEVTFAIDANGQLAVHASESTTGTVSRIDITPSYGLSDEQKERLLQQGQSNAKRDMLTRGLFESQVEAEREIMALNSALIEFEGLLSDTEKNTLAQAISDVQQVVTDIDNSVRQNLEDTDNAEIISIKQRLESATTTLKPLSDKLASQIMNSHIKDAMTGTKTDDWS